MKAVESGIWAGILATGPMTMSMFAMQEALPEGEKSPLPPAALTSELLEEAGVEPRLVPANTRENATMISHLGYGAGCGVAYSLLEKKIPGSPLVKGSLFGLGVWAASYLGWIPAFGFRASAHKMPVRRTALMVASHIIWGAALGYAESEMHKHGWQVLDGEQKAPDAE